MTTSFRHTIAIFAMTLICAAHLHAATVTILTKDQTLTVENALVEGAELWIPEAEVQRVTGYELKPEGACLGEICIPMKMGKENLAREEKGAKLFHATGFAKRIKQPVVADEAAAVWSFGPAPSVVAHSLQSGLAPDFELKDLQGKTHKLSDYRGKKVLLLTWASWCACSLDLPNWEKLYGDLKDNNFEIIAAAQDTGGAEAAGKHYERAGATFTTLVDPYHTVSSLYQMVNVPTGVWIDETGHIVRPGEVSYAMKVKLGTISVDGEAYAAALRDWVANGEKSAYVMPEAKRKLKTEPRDEKLALADANFKMGVHFHLTGDDARAEKYWVTAQQLSPDNWNYHRQDWSFTRDAMKNWAKKVQGLGDKEYYEPLEMEPTSGQ